MNRNRYTPKSGRLEGGFGAVSELHDRYLDRNVLYKSMHNPANNAQISNEVECLTRARSRHIVEIYDVAYDAGGNITGIIIEKLTGRDFSTFHLQASAEHFLKTIYQIASALADLHSAGIVHRDLKLENFRESAAGIIKLFDFGISSPATDHFTHAQRGTVAYAAPELYIPGSLISPAVDIYALGVCCWTLLSPTLPPPLLERPPQQTAAAPPIASLLPSGISPDLGELIDSCLSPAPRNRPTAKAFADACFAQLTAGKHKGRFVSYSRRKAIYELSAASPNVRLTISGLGEIRALYTGTDFKITAVTGDVFLNNNRLQADDRLHDACVLTFGDFHLGSDREYLSFFSSRPEIVL